MPDYAGAVAAIKQRLRDNFTACRVEEENLTPAQPWPPIDDNAIPQPFVVVEVTANSSDIQGVGAPGAQLNVDYGHVRAHVCVETGSGNALAQQLATQIAAIFRNKEFYNETQGFCVRTWRPYTDPGGISEIEWEGVTAGQYWRVTMTAEFEYWHLD